MLNMTTAPATTVAHPQAAPYLPAAMMAVPAPYDHVGARYGVMAAITQTPRTGARGESLIAINQNPQWLARAIELCEKVGAGFKFAARQHTFDGRIPCETWFVRTRDGLGPDHFVRFDCEHGVFRCDCIAGEYGRPCCHTGAVLFFMMSYDDAYRLLSAQDQAKRDGESDREYAISQWSYESGMYW